MGASLNHSPLGTGRSLRRRPRRQPMSEINVTPFVDVMLVLLVIFMVTAPLLTVGVPVDLPETKASTISEKKEPITITITKNGKVYLQESQIPLKNLVAKVKAIMEESPGTRIFVRGDQKIAYGRVIEVMGTLNAAGFHKVALLAQLPKKGKKKKR